MNNTELNRDQLLELAVQSAAKASTYGSYSDRNPVLGKMRRCPHCRRRRREAEVCCSAKYLKTNTGDVPRSFYHKKRKIPRLTRNRPPLLEMHQILLGLERQPGYIEREGISGIVEASILRRRRAKTAKKRGQERKSRKINRRTVWT